VSNIKPCPQTQNSILSYGICAITDGFVIFFAGWTLLSHIIVWSGLSFHILLQASILAPGIVAIWFIINKRTIGIPESAYQPEKSIDSIALRIIGIAIAILLSAIFLITKQYLIAWSLSTVFLLANRAILNSGNLGSATDGVISKDCKRDYFLIGISILLPLLTILYTSRPDLDDSLYLNMAVYVLDHPTQSIFTSDTLHGIEGGNYLPSYRVHSYELLIAVLSFFTSREPIEVAHLWLPLMAVLLSVLALARLFKMLIPHGWSWTVLICVIILLVFRETHWIYGNFAYFRIFQGKSWFVTIAVPLIVVYAVSYFQKGGTRYWILLSAAQIASIGLTANALYVAPLTAGLALVSCWKPNREAICRIFKGLLGSSYPVMMGLAVLFTMKQMQLNTTGVGPYLPVEKTTLSYLGYDGTAWLWFVALLGSWAIVSSDWLRRWLLGYSLIFTGIFLSPLWDNLWAKYVTGAHLLWRFFWAIPLAVFLSIAIFEFIHQARYFRKPNKIIAGVMGVSALLFSFQSIQTPSGEHEINSTPIILKVHQPDYQLARTIVALSNPEDVVLAPERISAWIPTIRSHPKPLVSRNIYMKGLINVFALHVDVPDLKNRLKLLAFISGRQRPENAHQLLMKAIDRHHLAIVAVSTGNLWYSDIETVLINKGYCPSSIDKIILFLRPDRCRKIKIG